VKVGTNQSHNINEIHNVHLYQSTKFLNVPRICQTFATTGSRQLRPSDNFKWTVISIEPSLPLHHTFGRVFSHMSVGSIYPWTIFTWNWKRI